MLLPDSPDEEDLGWSRVVSGPVEIFPVPGNHLSLMAEPHVRVLAERLRGCLERALAGEVESTLWTNKSREPMAEGFVTELP
jgi:thioesterase domain-containing protein